MNAPPTEPRRRLFRFSLKGLLLFVAIVAAGLGWELHVVRERNAMRTWIREHGGLMSGDSPEGLAFARKDRIGEFPKYRRLFGDAPEFLLFLDEPIATADRE